MKHPNMSVEKAKQIIGNPSDIMVSEYCFTSLEPGSAYSEPSRRKAMSVSAFLVAYWRAACLQPRWALVFCAAAIGQVAYQLGVPFAYRIILDSGVIAADHGALGYGVGFLALTLVIFAGAAVLHEVAVSRIASAWGCVLRITLFENILRERTAARTNRLADLISGDVATVEIGAARGAPVIMVQAFVAAFCIAALFTIEWRLALVAAAAAPCVILAPRFVARWQTSRVLTEDTAMTRVAAYARETAVARSVVRVFALGTMRTHHFSNDASALAREVASSQLRVGLDGRAAYVTSAVAQLAIIGLGGWLGLHGIITVGDLVAFIGLVFSAAEAMGNASQALPMVATGAAALCRLEDAGSQETPPLIGGARIPKPHHTISIQRLTFSSSEDTELRLNRISVSVRAGESLALVGPSGSGKSTLLALLLRLERPTGGRILIDDISLADAAEESVRQTFTFVPQDAVLFDVTVSENIRLGRPGASDADVVEAARLAALHEEIVRFPDGYNTRVGLGGELLSGGQRQRVAIARALLCNAPVLVLDEPTSALDAVTENRVMHNLRTLSGRRTIVMAGHRLATLAWCDSIAVLEGGRLVDIGRHPHLLSRSLLYRQMWDKQHEMSFAHSAEAAR
jgi:ATP-binding cassette, subfamily B, bacterial